MGEFDHVTEAFESSPLYRALAAISTSGDYSKLTSQAKRQHFLPRMLLRNFGEGGGAARSIFQLAVDGGQPLLVPVEKAASRHRMYAAVDESGVASSHLEGYLALVESHAAPALERFLSAPLALTNADRATISLFIAMQMQRTPAAAARIHQTVNAAFQAYAGSLFSDTYGFEETYKEHFGEPGTAAEREAFRQQVLATVRRGGVRLADPGGASIAAGLELAAEESFLLFEFDWALLSHPGGFITSDRAFSIHDPEPPFPWTAEGILSSPAVEVFVPLSADMCLLLRPLGHGLRVQEVPDRHAEIVNLRTWSWASRHVFGCSASALERIARVAHAYPSRLTPPRVFCHVALLEPDPDDDSFAEENRSRGWPGQLDDNGRLWDYVVIPTDQPYPEIHKRVDEAAENRGRKRLGATDDVGTGGVLSVRPRAPHSNSIKPAH